MPISSPPPIAEIAPGIPFAASEIVVPAGIECPLDYQNIRLNNRTYLEHIRVVSIDGLDDADIRAIVENNPGDHGESVFDSPLYSGRTLVLNCRTESQSLRSMRGMKQAVRTAFNDLEEHPLIWRTLSTATDHQIFCRKSAPIAGVETQGTNPKFTREFPITLRASNPRFLSFESHAQQIILSTQKQIVIQNAGNFPSTCRIQISGSASNISFINHTTGQYMHVNSVLSDGQFRMLNMDKLGVKITDENGVSRYNEIQDDARRVTLWPGENIIEMIASTSSFGANAKMIVYWYDSWI
jgi:phage-related protein